MNYKLIFILPVVIALSAVTSLEGQCIEGQIQNLSGAPVKGAVVYLKNDLMRKPLSDSSDVKGYYKLCVSANGVYRLTVSHEVYREMSTELTFKGQSIRKDFVLSDSIRVFKAVSVKSQQTPVVQKGDTVEYNASAFKVNENATAENLVTKMPGITSENGVIKAQGEEIKKVTVDGNDYFGDDASAALKNLPAEMVDKVQIYDRKSDQARFSGIDDGNSQKALNIVTKSGKSKVRFGRVFAGAGSDQRYSAGGNYNLFNSRDRLSFIGMSNNINQQNFSMQDILGSMGVTNAPSGGMMRQMQASGVPPPGQGSGGPADNYFVSQQDGVTAADGLGINYNFFGSKKLNLSASWFSNHSVNRNESELSRQYFLSNGSTQFYQQKDSSVNTNYNHRFNAKLEYNPDSLNSFIYTPQIRYQKYNKFTSQSTTNRVPDSEAVLNTSNTSNPSEGDGVNLNQTLSYRRRFKNRPGALIFSLQNSYSESNNLSHLTAAYHYPQSGSSVLQQQKTESVSNSFSLVPSVTYTGRFRKSWVYELSYKYSLTDNRYDKSTRVFNQSANVYDRLDTALSSQYNNRISFQNAGLNLKYQTATWNLTAGLNVQELKQSGDQLLPLQEQISHSYLNVLPSVYLVKQFSKSENLRVSYRTSTNVPSVTQLQAAVDNSNPLVLSTGNPLLKQEYNHTVNLRYSRNNSAKGRTFFTFLNLSRVQDYIGNTTLTALNDTLIDNRLLLKQGTRLNLPVNLGAYTSASLFSVYGLPIKQLKSNLNFTFGENLTQSPAYLNGQLNTNTTFNSRIGAFISSNISEKTDFSVGYNFNHYLVENTIQTSVNSNYRMHNLTANGSFQFGKRWGVAVEMSGRIYRGLSSGYNQKYLLMTPAVFYRFGQSYASELRLSCFDLLKQNNSISRTINETYTEDKQNTVLGRYLLLTYSYKLRKLGSGSVKRKGE